MTQSRHHAAPMRATRSNSTVSRILSAGLATAAGIGFVGVLAARQLEGSAAAQTDQVAQTADTTPAVSSTGLTQEQLDAYAAQLQSESVRLDAYRASLAAVAASLTSTAAPQGSTPSAANTKTPQPAAKAAPRPAPKPVAKPAPQPTKAQSNTRSS